MANSTVPVVNPVNLELDSSFLWEIWAWFVIGVSVIFLRFGVRLRTVGLRGFQGDDYVTFVVLLCYAMDAILVHIVYEKGSNVDVADDMVPYLTGNDIKILESGSKAQLGAWYSYTALIWCMKFCVLFFYKRLTMKTWQNRLLNHMFWVCGVTYTAVFLTVTFGCHPYHENWQVKPKPSKQCTFKPQNFLVSAVLNILTDGIILSIPVPLLWKLQVPFKKKIAVAALLSSGLFIISAAVIRAALTLGNAPSGLNINRWGVRETIIGILAVNAPILAPLFTRAFWTRGPYRPMSGRRGNDSSSVRMESRGARPSGYDRKSHFSSTVGRSQLSTLDSDEEAILEGKDALQAGGGAGAVANVVLVEQTYDIRLSERDEGSFVEGRAEGWGRGGQNNTEVTALDGDRASHPAWFGNPPREP